MPDHAGNAHDAATDRSGRRHPRTTAPLRPNDGDAGITGLATRAPFRGGSLAARYEGFGREANRTLSDLELPPSVPKWAKGTPIPSLKSVTVAREAHTDLSTTAGGPTTGSTSSSTC